MLSRNQIKFSDWEEIFLRQPVLSEKRVYVTENSNESYN